MCVCVCTRACVDTPLLQSCLTISNPIDHNPPGSSLHEILQARIGEWVAMTAPRVLRNCGIESTTLLSNALKWFFTTEASYYRYVYLVAQFCLTVCDLMDYSLPGSSFHGDSPGKNTGVGLHTLLQGIFPTQRLNPDLPHCSQIPDHLSHQGSPRILEWVNYSFFRGSSWPRNWNWVLCIAGIIFYQLSYQGINKCQWIKVPFVLNSASIQKRSSWPR